MKVEVLVQYSDLSFDKQQEIDDLVRDRVKSDESLMAQIMDIAMVERNELGLTMDLADITNLKVDEAVAEAVEKVRNYFSADVYINL